MRSTENAPGRDSKGHKHQRAGAQTMAVSAGENPRSGSKRRALASTVTRVLLLGGVLLAMVVLPWAARAATIADPRAFWLGGWAAEEALGFDPFNPWRSVFRLSSPSSTSSKSTAETTTYTSDGGSRTTRRPPVWVPNRPGLRTPERPPW